MSISIKIKQIATIRNDAIAEENKRIFKEHNIRCFNMIGSPGCGKTSILESMSRVLGHKLAVITGDLKTTYDADRLNKAGCRAMQIETGGGCHLTAKQINEALTSLPLDGVELCIIENVGNLVCPSAYELGEEAKIAVLSVAEGDEKPVKYPTLFSRASIVIISKTDLLPHVEFSVQRVKTDCQKLSAGVKIIEFCKKSPEDTKKIIDLLRPDTPYLKVLD
jgi:hydrogenase nickel incorporation protein HypB